MTTTIRESVTVHCGSEADGGTGTAFTTTITISTPTSTIKADITSGGGVAYFGLRGEAKTT